MFCKKCGNEVASDALFCERCGASLSVNTDPPPQQQVPPQPPPPPVNNYTNTSPYQNGNPQPNAFNNNPPHTPPPKKKPGCLIAFLVVLGIAVFGVVILGIIGLATSDDDKTVAGVTVGKAYLAKSIDSSTMKPITKVSGFNTEDTELYYSCYVKKAPQGTQFLFEWYYNGQKVNETPTNADEYIKNRYVGSWLTRAQGFPAGSYEVRLYVVTENSTKELRKTSFKVK